MNGPGTAHSFWSRLFVLLLSAFGLNWLWEMVQMPAYVEMAGRPWKDSLVPCTIATLGDIAITLAVAGSERWRRGSYAGA